MIHRLVAGALAAVLVAATAVAAPLALTGVVKERLDAPPYSYLRLETKHGGTRWAAIPVADVKVGDRVTIVDALPMENFESKSLKRKFKRLYFGYLKTDDAGDAPGPAAEAPGDPPPERPAPSPAPDPDRPILPMTP